MTYWTPWPLIENHQTYNYEYLSGVQAHEIYIKNIKFILFYTCRLNAK